MHPPRRAVTARTLFLAAALLVAARTNAADLVWIGGTGNWDAAGNWSPAQIPGPGDNVFITGAGDYTVTLDKPDVDPAVIGSLVLGGPSGTQTLSIGNVVLRLNGASVVNANGRLDITLASSELTGPGSVTVDGTLNWANGTIVGPGVTTIGSGGTMTIGGGVTLLTRTLDNGGTVNWDSGNLNIDTGAVINNLAGGTFSIRFDGTAKTGGTGGGGFNNAGIVQKTAGAASARLILPFNNSGTVDVQSGTLSLEGGGTHTGTLSSALGATIAFGGGAHVLTSSSLVTGEGGAAVNGTATTLNASGAFDPAGSRLNVSAGTATLTAGCNVTGTTLGISGGVLNFNSAGSVATVNLTAGTLGGTSPVIVTGLLTLGGGTVTNPLVTASGGLTINGNTTLSGGKLVNPANALWSAGNLTGVNGAVFSNLVGATIVNTFDGNFATGTGATPTFVNAGLFQKTGATAPLGKTAIDFQFLNTGTVEVRTNTLRYAFNQQTAGLTLLSGGGLDAQAQALQFLGGTLTGTGLVTMANTQILTNSATINPGLPLGELDLVGNYRQTPSGTLSIELGGSTPGVDFDRVTVTGGGGGGVATLGGTLEVTLTNGFTPAKGSTFTFLTAVSRVGAFSTFNYPSNDIGMQLIYGATDATIKVTNLKPVVANPISTPAPGTYGEVFSFQFPANTFSDPDSDPLSYNASGMPPGISFVGATRTFSGTPTQAGIFPVQVTATDGGSPSLTATNTFTITIDPALLTIAAQPQSKSYGAADPVLTYVANGFKLNDTAETQLTGTLTRSGGENVAESPYAITQGSLAANSNYSVGFTGNTLAITPAPLSVTADAKAKTYGASDPAFTASYAGFVNGETPTVLDGILAFTRAPGEAVGGHTITPSGLTSTNYAISFHSGTLTISPATLTVTATAQSKTYGAALALNGTTGFTSAGLQNGETIGSVTLNASGSPAGTAATAPVGNYTITPSAATGGTFTAANYSITYATGTLTVDPATLTVTADDKTKMHGAADPTFTASYAGFVNGETPAVLGGLLTFTRAPGEAVGTYAITPGGLTSPNYTITYVPGTLTITEAPVPVILPLTRLGTDSVLITWSAASGVTYRVQYEQELSATKWTDLPGDVTASGSTASKTDAITGTNRFYRVMVVP